MAVAARFGGIDRSSRGETWDAGSTPSQRRSRAERGGVVTFRRRRDGEPDTTAPLGRQIRIWLLDRGSLRGAPPAGAGQRLQGGVASRAGTAPTRRTTRRRKGRRRGGTRPGRPRRP